MATLTAEPRVRVVEPWMTAANVTNDIDPDDYANDTDYLMAIPGMKEKLISGMNAPSSKCKRAPREYFNV